MKEYPKTMSEEMLPVIDLKAKMPEGGWNIVAGASTYAMFLDESDNTMIRVFFDLDSINKSYNIIKYATSQKVSFELTAESGLVLSFDGIVTNLGRNHATFRVKRKDITDLF